MHDAQELSENLLWRDGGTVVLEGVLAAEGGKTHQGQSHLLQLRGLGWWTIGLGAFRLTLCFVTVDEFIG